MTYALVVSTRFSPEDQVLLAHSAQRFHGGDLS
ncbi:hypothetical protein AAKU58_003494 [Oxalobacteraceae bacterium GrIS 1.18]